MFIDGITSKIVPARVKPVMVVLETRPKTYYNMVEDAETGEMREVISSGFEIVKEAKTAPPQVLPVGKPTLGFWRAISAGVAEHGRKCKKQITAECPTCMKNIAIMASVPVHILPEVL